MNIKGYGEVSTIRLIHKGCEMNFENMLPVVYLESAPITPSTFAFIEFKDISEVEMMIHMLKRFRDGCIEGMGKWEEKR